MTFAGLEELHGRPLLKKKTLTDVSYIEACVKYEGYIDIQKREVARMKKMAATAIPADLDFAAVAGLSSEIRQKLARARPATLREAARIPGVTPAAINAISIHLTLKYKALRFRDFCLSSTVLAPALARGESALHFFDLVEQFLPGHSFPHCRRRKRLFDPGCPRSFFSWP